MTSYRLQILPDEPSQIEHSRERIKQEIKDFQSSYLTNNPHKKDDERIKLLFKDLNDGRFWGTLSYMDGASNPQYSPFLERSTPHEQRKKRENVRLWARQNFSDANLEQILNVAVNTAFLAPFGTYGWPGLTRPHSILYRELVEKTDSMFSGIIDGQFRKRLNNGRFWEELPDMWSYLNSGLSFHVVADVLESNFGDLDVSFAPKGFRIFYGKTDVVKSDPGRPCFELSLLNNRAIDLYLKFLKRLDLSRNEVGISEEDIGYLVAPYVVEVLNTREGAPRFNGRKSEDYKTRLRDPMINHYVNNSKHVRKVMVGSVDLRLCYGSNKPMVRDFIDVLDDKTQFLSGVLYRAESYNKSRIVEELKRLGIEVNTNIVYDYIIK